MATFLVKTSFLGGLDFYKVFTQFLKLRKVAWHFYDQKLLCYLGQLKIEIAKAESDIIGKPTSEIRIFGPA